MDDATPPDIVAKRCENLKAGISARIGSEAAEALIEGLQRPAQIAAAEALFRSTSWSRPQKEPPKATWETMSALDKIAQAHKAQAIHDAKLASKKG